MGEHLPMVLSALFNIDNEYLLQPESELGKVVPFVDARHGQKRVHLPDALKTRKPRRRRIDVL